MVCGYIIIFACIKFVSIFWVSCPLLRNRSSRIRVLQSHWHFDEPTCFKYDVIIWFCWQGMWMWMNIARDTKFRLWLCVLMSITSDDIIYIRLACQIEFQFGFWCLMNGRLHSSIIAIILNDSILHRSHALRRFILIDDGFVFVFHDIILMSFISLSAFIRLRLWVSRHDCDPCV